MAESAMTAPTDPSSPDGEIVTRATELVTLIREHAAQGDESRRVVPEVVRALEDAGLFHLLVPQRWGGANATIRTAVDVVSEVARGDGSAGWITSLLMTGAGYAATFSEQAQQEVFGANPRAKVGGVFTPGSTSERVDGGYLVSGRWPYSSASFVADWAILGLLLEGDDPLGAALIPAEAFTIEPSWFMTGMKGTGSDTIVVEDHFLPDHRVQRFKDMAEANFLSSDKEHRLTSVSLPGAAALFLAAPQLGIGKHALEVTRAKLPGKPVAHTAYQQARLSPTHHTLVAKAATNLHLAELALHRISLDLDQACAARDLLTRGRIRNDTGAVAELVSKAVDLLLTANGAGSFAEANVLSRIWQDSSIAARHGYLTPEIGREAYGRLLLSHEEPTLSL
ncbi:acyl-CoA dehydrogenase family protein [Streptomyces sp. HC307]|uniref:acyl-CoA dehydrogenase family protein n=1 Tax=Streptomyces flavusporus TaxID=3385496 RepID=UPI00391712AD